MINTSQLTFFCLFYNTVWSSIQINIDASDALKLLKEFMSSSSNFQAESSRKAFVQTKYKNPYHPEDEVILDNIKTSREHSIAIKENGINIKLEDDNEKFVLQGDNISQDVLTDDDEFKNRVLSDELPLTSSTTEKAAALLTSKNNEDETDTKNFKRFQRRFIKKSS
ncbi:uncharacterized protein [Choristoneura fumiferana]|uniref:uncharacterized protein n=1 Tax=Choristoneura fumiferana TaxID=7141 RepID=UPI003D157E00